MANYFKWWFAFFVVFSWLGCGRSLPYGIISLLVCIGFCFRKTGTFNSITIPLIIVVQLILTGISTLFHLDTTNILNYEFQYIIGNLIANPSNTYILQTLVLAIFYIIVFNVIGYRVFRKTEIK